MIIDRDGISRLIPHQGRMCLLDRIVEWDRERIVCHSARHRAIDNPLCEDDRLSAMHAIEFAAQAMAAHHRLNDGGEAVPRFGLLVSVRQCTFAADRLDACESPLVIEAIRVASSAHAFTYRFAVGSTDTPLVIGRASIALFANVE